jgi:phosphatidylglycerophosphatase A
LDRVKASQSPSLQFLLAHPAHLIACGFGSGLSPVAPGTVGTLFSWLTFLPLRAFLGDQVLLVLLAVSFLLGIIVVQRTGADLGEPDHGSIVWDEIVPFWGVLYLCPQGVLWQVIAFALFRFFDIVKPQPAKYFDEKVKNGFGVMADDLCAAAYSVLALKVLWHFFPGISL